MKLRRPKLRFSLRAFLLVVSLFAIWLSTTIQRVNRQKTAVAKIESVGGSLRYDFEPSHDERLRRCYERTKATLAGKTPPTYTDEPNVPKLLVARLGVDSFARVEAVNLSNTLCTNDDLQTILTGLPALESLDLSHVPYITSEGLAPLSSAKLKSLVLDGNRYRNGRGETGLDDSALAHLSSCRNLQSLSLHQNRFTDEGLKHLSRLKRLKTLNIKSTDVTSAGLVHIANLKRLKTLRLPFLIDDEALQWMGGLVELEFLGRLHFSVTDKGLASIQRLQNLKSLSLHRTQVTDDGLKVLNSLSELEFISLGRTNVTSEGIKRMGFLPKLKSITLDKTEIDDECVHTLSSMKTIQILSVRQTNVSDAGLERLSSLLPEAAVFPTPINLTTAPKSRQRQ